MEKKSVSYPDLSQTCHRLVTDPSQTRHRPVQLTSMEQVHSQTNTSFIHLAIYPFSVIHHLGLQGRWSIPAGSGWEAGTHPGQASNSRSHTLTPGAASSAQTCAALWAASLTVGRQRLDRKKTPKQKYTQLKQSSLGWNKGAKQVPRHLYPAAPTE